MLNFAIIIPVYNEELTIEQTLSHLQEALINDKRSSYIDYKIFVYDNNSTDNTVSKVLPFDTINFPVELRNAPIQGKGSVIRQAFSEIEADCYCIIDGDDTYDPSKIMDFYYYITEKNADMVIGDRLSTDYFSENKRPFHNFGNRIVRFLVNGIYNFNYSDILSGFRAFSYPFAKTFPAKSDGFVIETEMNIFAAEHKLTVYNVPIVYQDRISGSTSKLKTIPDGIKILSFILTAMRRNQPILFYGCLCLICLAFGIGGMPDMRTLYFSVNRVYLCCITIFIGIFFFLIGCFRYAKLLDMHEQFQKTYRSLRR